MQEELITAALVNGLCKAWGDFKSLPEAEATSVPAAAASMTLLAVRPLGLEFGVQLDGETNRVYKLDLVLAAHDADIALSRRTGSEDPDSFDDLMTGLLLTAFETTVGPVVKFASSEQKLDAAFAGMTAGSTLLH